MAIRTLPKNSDSVVQAEMFHEDIHEALRGLVAALGGAKVVAARLYPDLTPDAAARKLLDALNPDRAQQLSLTQFVTLLKWGRDAGHHSAIFFVTDEAGYTRPSPVEPADARAELQRQFIDAVNRAEQIGKWLRR